MPRYTFTGAYPRVLTGLSEGVNAHLEPLDGHTVPAGATLEANHGDTIITDEPFEHPELAEITEAPAVPEPTPTPVAEPAPAVTPEPAPEPEPAHDAMTAEGAPAPAMPAA